MKKPIRRWTDAAGPVTCRKKRRCVISWISSSETSSGKNLALNLNCRGFSFFTSCWVTCMIQQTSQKPQVRIFGNLLEGFERFYAIKSMQKVQKVNEINKKKCFPSKNIGKNSNSVKGGIWVFLQMCLIFLQESDGWSGLALDYIVWRVSDWDEILNSADLTAEL